LVDIFIVKITHHPQTTIFFREGEKLAGLY
jgi:hypothetical protein